MFSARGCMIFSAVLMLWPILLAAFLQAVSLPADTGGSATLFLGFLTVLWGPISFLVGALMFILSLLVHMIRRRKRKLEAE